MRGTDLLVASAHGSASSRGTDPVYLPDAGVAGRSDPRMSMASPIASRFFTCLLLACMSVTSYASGTVAPTYNPSAPPIVKYYSWANSHLYADTPEEACAIFATQEAVNWIGGTPWAYHHIEPYNENIIACFATNPPRATVTWLAQIPIKRSCDGLVWSNVAITCGMRICPANSTGTPMINPTICTCNTDYVPDPTGTSCVPAATCPVDPLTPLTDPVAIGFENGNRWRPDKLTADYQTKLTCVQNGIAARGGSSVGTSAYRPTQYQQHLFEIVQKDKQLFPGYMALHPECQALRDEITRAMGPPPGHGLKRKQKVAKPGTSRHETGTAFDVTPSGLTDAQLAPVYSGCGVTHTAVRSEPWHVQ